MIWLTFKLKSAAIWRWLGRHHQQVKLVFAVAAAFWVYLEYTGKKSDERVARTVEYIKQAGSGEILAAEINITKYLIGKEFKEKQKKISDGDKKSYADLMISTVETSLMTEVWQTYNFYKSLAICVNADLCDAETACNRFYRDIKIFDESFGPYFARYRAEYSDDAFRPIRKMLGQQACVKLGG